MPDAVLHRFVAARRGQLAKVKGASFGRPRGLNPNSAARDIDVAISKLEAHGTSADRLSHLNRWLSASVMAWPAVLAKTDVGSGLRDAFAAKIKQVVREHLARVDGVIGVAFANEGGRVHVQALVDEHGLDLQGRINEAEAAIVAALPGIEVEVATRACQGRPVTSVAYGAIIFER